MRTSLRRAGRLAARERDEDHLVAAGRLAVPRAVLADEHPLANFARQRVASPNAGPATRCARPARSRARSPSPPGPAAAASRASSTCCAVVAVRPAVEAAVLHRGQVVGHEIAAQLVALVDRRPQRAASRGSQAMPTGLRRPDAKTRMRARRASRSPRSPRGPSSTSMPCSATLLFDPTADVELRAVAAGDQALGPVVVDRPGGQVGHLRAGRPDAASRRPRRGSARARRCWRRRGRRPPAPCRRANAGPVRKRCASRRCRRRPRRAAA